MKFGNISDTELLKENMSINCIHENVVSMDATHYEDFFMERRKLMAKKIKTIITHYDKKSRPRTKAICNKGFSGNSSMLPRLNFGVGGQESGSEIPHCS